MKLFGKRKKKLDRLDYLPTIEDVKSDPAYMDFMWNYEAAKSTYIIHKVFGNESDYQVNTLKTDMPKAYNMYLKMIEEGI